MAKNDVLLLDSLVEKSKTQFNICSDDSELFEIFVFDQVLKEYEPSIDDLETGWTDGGNDGGIDGFFVFVDHQIGNPDSILSAAKRSPKLDVFILSVRKTKRFEQLPLDTLISSLGELLDLTNDESELTYPYNETVLQQRDILKLLLTGLADRRPRIKIHILYCSRGDTSDISPNVLSRGTALSDLIKNLFSNAGIKVAFLGAAELLSLARKPIDFTIRLPFSETYISREGKNYVFLCTLLNYYKAIIDDDGKLKRYLFESNVRDYLGQGSIAADIAKTLQEEGAPDQRDFWWLNNGVTIIGTRAYVVAKEILVENAQIVNGLQTTETLNKYFLTSQSKKDDRAILIKVLSTANEDTRAQIIKATNYQNTVELSSLRGLDKIQRDIEAFLLDHGWFYDRRKNYYKNLGKPAERIVSVTYLAAAVRAIALRDPVRSPRQRSKSLRDNDVYNAVFNPEWDLNVFLACIQITRTVELSLKIKRSPWDTPPMALSHMVGFTYACLKLGRTDYPPNAIAHLVGKEPSEFDVKRIVSDLARSTKDDPPNGRRHRGVLLYSNALDIVAQMLASAPLTDSGVNKPTTDGAQ